MQGLIETIPPEDRLNAVASTLGLDPETTRRYVEAYNRGGFAELVNEIPEDEKVQALATLLEVDEPTARAYYDCLLYTSPSPRD